MRSTAEPSHLCLAVQTPYNIVFVMDLVDVVERNGMKDDLDQLVGFDTGRDGRRGPPIRGHFTLRLGVAVLDDCISRKQFRVHFLNDDKTLYLSNLSFSSPTHVNGNLVHVPHKLGAGDVITIGKPNMFRTPSTGIYFEHDRIQETFRETSNSNL
ncbi:hypothetical protein CYMTET_28242 [Cymbomonas tetramitiformis]|uniref:FHA domain-containing protein n=1 Tax=Cymbomonas tetramitiformis TaxID=36881 RepID=A0AAE0FKF1_9CHLO|nr:hypothetical protein CYMTET_29707 [Cymbomonas tetramitiformis]KAK3262928.1 hypothetical protein CYMTET_28242 [Cymbomonas tetramitiformis]|eukprot:gene7169-8548_t